jgi:hypothetical protein
VQLQIVPTPRWVDDGVGTAVSISTAARAVGLSIDTLRMWQRRYGLGPSRVSAGGHRRYTPVDLERLRHAKRLIASGTATAEAVRAVGPVGGRLDLPGTAAPAAHELANLVVRLDGPAVRQVVEREMRSLRAVECWERVLQPVLGAFGAGGLEPSLEIAAEHLLSHVITAVCSGRVPHPGDEPSPTVRQPVLACAQDEEHELPITVLAAALAEVGIPAVCLGRRTTSSALDEASRSTPEPIVLIFALMEAELPTVDPSTPQVPVIWAGPGWRGRHPGDDPSHLRRQATSMRNAFQLLADECASR